MDGLRIAAVNGTLPPGTILPTVRELSAKYKLSVRVVSQELQRLIDEGVLYTLPRKGTFVGRPLSRISDLYLLLYDRPIHVNAIRGGFEERISELGASSLTLPAAEAVNLSRSGELPQVCGVFDFAHIPVVEPAWVADPEVPYVRFAPPEWVQERLVTGHMDTIYFDDIGGGRQAAHHLLRLGHERIAFLGLHRDSDHSALYAWSAGRCEGWRQALASAGIEPDGLLFVPDDEPVDLSEEAEVARRAARRLAQRDDIDAVLAANDNAVIGLFDALHEAGAPDKNWPAVIGFDDLPGAAKFVLTSMRLPWEDVGRAAADLLFHRRIGALQGPPEERIIPMKLIPRLSSTSNWRRNRSIAVASLPTTS